jgi:hypothetical protein
MWLEAVLTKDDLQDVFQQFAPLTIRLGESGELTLDAPSDVTFDSQGGVRVVCTARLAWSVLGLHVPVTIHSLIALITPVIERPGARDEALVFKLALEHADIAALPALFDSHVTARVNEELLKKHVELSWEFRKLLDHVFALPPTLESADGLALRVKASVVKMTSDALGFAVNLGVDVRRRPRDSTITA